MLLGAGVWLKHTGQQLSSLWKAESSRECWCDGEGTDWNLEFQEYFPAHFYRNWFLQSHKWCETYKEKKKKKSQKILKQLPAPNPCSPKLTGRLTSQLSSQRALTTSVKPWLTAMYRAVHLALFSRSALAPLASSTRATSAWFLV